MKRAAFLTVLSITAAFLTSGCLWGVVRDADTGVGVSGATVSYTDSRGHSQSTTTVNGLYVFDIAMGPIPAAGPAAFQVSGPGYEPLTATRSMQYNDNPNATGENLSSYWEVQHFDLELAPTASSGGTTIRVGVDAYLEHISQEPSGLSGVYKYVDGRGWQSYVSSYIEAAYQSDLRPILVFYTNFDSTSPDFVAWDETMDAIRSDGRDVWVIVEPDMWGYIKNEGRCGSLGRQHVDRFLSTRPSNARLGFLFNHWSVPYIGAQDDAQEWRECWLAAGGERMADIYVDVSDRDQEYYGTYPWPASKFVLYEEWFAALHEATGRKVKVWQIPLGNSGCHNSRQSNFVETWLSEGKMSELSADVEWLLFGPGVETGSQAQSWNLPGHDKYECGFFNARVGG
jgi:hypothetical protein